MIGLLVSVRNPLEADAALAGGADLIDLKEPTRGSLGAPDFPVIQRVIRTVANRAPISIALGEFTEGLPGWVPQLTGICWWKWGLAGCGDRIDFPQRWLLGRQDLLMRLPRSEMVAVAYADWQRAAAPRPERVIQLAIEHGIPVVLIDTYKKDGLGLGHWMPLGRLKDFRALLSQAGVKLALAGSLSEASIETLLPLAPDWFAVRGAVCAKGDRSGTVQVERVHTLARLLRKENCTCPVE